MSISNSRSKWLLAAIVATYCVLGVLYAVETPKWQTPDEPAHFNYTQFVAQSGRLPVLHVGDYPAQYLEEIKAARFPAAMSVSSIRYESHQPPLYYAWAALLYDATIGLPFDLQFLILRLFSVALGALLLLAAYRLVCTLFPGEELLALGATGFIALVPMHLALTAAVNNDTLAELLLMLLLWQCALTVREGADARRTVCIGVLLGLALLTKTTIYLPAIGTALATVWLCASPQPPEVAENGDQDLQGLWQGAKQLPGGRAVFALSSVQHTKAGFRNIALVLAVALLLAGPWFVRNALVYGGMDLLAWKRHELVVAGQLRTAERLAQLGLPALIREFALTTFRSFWAQFGWMGVPVDQRIYLGLALFSTLSAMGLALFVLRLLRRPIPQTPGPYGRLEPWQAVGSALLALSAFWTVVTYVGYNLGFWQPQGRYLFTALGPLSVGFALALRELLRPKTARRLAMGLLPVGLLLLGYGLWRRDVPKWSLALWASALAWLGAAAWLPTRWRWLPPVLLSGAFVALNLVCVSAFVVPYLS